MEYQKITLLEEKQDIWLSDIIVTDIYIYSCIIITNCQLFTPERVMNMHNSFGYFGD